MTDSVSRHHFLPLLQLSKAETPVGSSHSAALTDNMVPPRLLISIITLCWIKGASLNKNKDVHQTPPDLLGKLNSEVKLTCSYKITNYDTILWYQRSVGDTSLKLIAYIYYKNPTVEVPFKGHFNVSGDGEKEAFLHILKLRHPEDSGEYFGAASRSSGSEAYFGNGTKLTVLEYDVTQPRVNILQPSSNECQDKTDRKNKKTLVCVASDFYPDHVSVSWQIEGVAVTDGVATDSAALRDGRFYSITSRLRVMARMWHTPGKKFTCIVSFYNGSSTSDHSDTVFGIKGPGEGMTREKYVTITQTAKFSYGVFIAKSSLYGVFVLVLVWKLQGSSGKQ